MVLLGEIRHCWRILLTLTRPYFGTARSMSKTLAVSRYSGGSVSRAWIVTRPPLRSRLSCARRVRMSLARWSASIRWVRERSGAEDCLAGALSVVGGMGGEYTDAPGLRNPIGPNSHEARPEVHTSSGRLTVIAG